MFKKLLKYDMLSVSRLWWLAAVIVPIASVMGAFLVRFLEDFEPINTVTRLIQIGAILLVVACVIAIILSFVLTAVLVYVRFYKNLFTDEGYLTFTLPATRKQILLAKTVNAFIWFVLHAILFTLAMVLFFGIVAPNEFVEAMKELGPILKDMWDVLGAWSVLYGAELIMLSLLGILMGISLSYLCITIGSIIAKKAKIVAAIGIYYAIYYGSSLLGQMLFSIFTIGMAPGFSTLTESFTDNQGKGFIALLLLIVICIIGVLTVTLYNLTQFLLDRKLNLA